MSLEEMRARVEAAKKISFALSDDDAEELRLRNEERVQLDRIEKEQHDKSMLEMMRQLDRFKEKFPGMLAEIVDNPAGMVLLAADPKVYKAFVDNDAKDKEALSTLFWGSYKGSIPDMATLRGNLETFQGALGSFVSTIRRMNGERIDAAFLKSVL